MTTKNFNIDKMWKGIDPTNLKISYFTNSFCGSLKTKHEIQRNTEPVR